MTRSGEFTQQLWAPSFRGSRAPQPEPEGLPSLQPQDKFQDGSGHVEKL